jgi:tetratricopeptide (TPR) repeat protein
MDRMRALILFLLCLPLFISSYAAEPAWWTQQKADCGLPPSLAYNDWVAQGMPCNRNGNSVKPSPTKAELEAKDLKEASDDENDRGVDSFKKHDWNTAINHFKAALGYNPENDDAIANLARALREARSALARQERAAQETARQEQERQANEARRTQEMSQIRVLVGKIHAIKVPPPIPAEDAVISFGELAPENHVSKNIILGTEIGVAVIDVVARIQNHALNLTPTKLVFVVGKTFIAAENAADVYIVKQNVTYEKALLYLKSDAAGPKFTAIVRAIKEHRPIDEDASIEMVRVAQAILDPKLGNSGTRIAWDSMLSLEARHAALTEVCIELGGEIIGQATARGVARLMVTRQPAFTEATEYLAKARVALQQVEDPATRDSLNEAVKLANEMIAKSYHAVHPGALGMEHAETIFFKTHEEEYREKKQ